MSGGRISGTPPTRVDTTYSPAQAASKMAIPKASVRDVFMNIDPRRSTWRSSCSVKASDIVRKHSHLEHRCVAQDREARCGLAGDVSPASEVDRSFWARRRLGDREFRCLYASQQDVPTTNRTFGNSAQIRGAVATSRSMSLRYAKRPTTTMVTGGYQ